MSQLREWLLETILKVYKSDIKSLKQEEDINHTFRMKLEKPIYDKLIELYMPTLKQAWLDGNGFSVDPRQTILLYETRCHENLEFLLYNLYYYVGRHQPWAVLFYCTDEVKSYVRSTIGSLAETIRFEPITSVFNGNDMSESHTQNRNLYNDMLLSRNFWDDLDSRGISHILIAQTDCYFRKPLSIDVSEYDYIPSPWAWNPESPGGGGLTIRRVQKGQEIHTKFPELACGQGEDAWFSEGIVKVGGTVDNSLFAESYPNTEAIGLHQWWTFLMYVDDIALDVFEKYMILELDA